MLGLFVQWGVTRAASDVELQLFLMEENAQQVTQFPYGKKYVIALVSQTTDLIGLLPITLRVRHTRVDAQDRIPNEPEKYCKDAHICALQGPVIMPKGEDLAIEIIASDKSGSEIASFKQGTLASPEARTTLEVNDPAASIARELPDEVAPAFYRNPFVLAVGGVFVLCLLALGIGSKRGAR